MSDVAAGKRSSPGWAPSSVPGRDLVHSVSAVCLGLLTLIALLLVWRRLGGSLVAAPPTAVLLVCGTLSAMLAAMVRVSAIPLLRSDPQNTTSWLWLAAPLPLLLILGLSLTFRGQSPAACLVFWGFIAMEEAAMASWLLVHRPNAEPGPGVASPVADPTQRSFPSPVVLSASGSEAASQTAEDDLEASELSSESPLDDGVTQQITRLGLPDGGERLQGWLRVSFAVGQRTAGAHVAFCPPFPATPHWEVEQIDGPEARVRTQQVLSFGARLELKLDEPAEEPTAVLLQVSAEVHT